MTRSEECATVAHGRARRCSSPAARVGPDYQQPENPMPDNFRGAPAPAAASRWPTCPGGTSTRTKR